MMKDKVPILQLHGILAVITMMALLSCDDRGIQPAGDENQLGVRIFNPSPPNGASELGMNVEFGWECESPDSGNLRYAVFMGTETLTRVWGPYPITGFRSSWGRHIYAKDVLFQIYQGQAEYYALHNHYALNGVSANFMSPNAFQSIGVIIDSSDWYNYAMGASSNTFVCYASANLDADPDNDTWQVNQTGIVTNTWPDIEVPYESGTTFQWKVVVYNERNDTASGPTWQLTTSPDSIPVNYPPNTPFNPFPADWGNPADTFPIFNWHCTDPENDTVVFDLYLGIAGALLLNKTSIPTTYLDTEWHRQNAARVMLNQIYALQQAYRDSAGCYCLNGVTASRQDNDFRMLGVAFSYLDHYTYTMTASCDQFSCMATADIDADTTHDIWAIASDDTLTHINEDCDVPYTPGMIYTWAVLARDSHGNETAGPVWNFITR